MKGDDAMKNLFIITGAAGHLGSTIIRNLIKGDSEIRGLILPSETEEFPERVRYYRGDVTKIESLDGIFSDLDEYETYVIHNAGLISIGGDDYDRLYSVNVQGTKNIIDKCIESGVKRLLYVSSVHAIPELHGHVITEVSSFDSTHVKGNYAKTKAEATRAVLEASENGLLDAVVVHPSGIIGPYDKGKNHIVQLVKMYLSGKLPASVSGGYDFVDVRDVALGCLEAVEKGRNGECYILSNSYVTINSIIERLSRITGGKRKICLPIWLAKCFIPLFSLISKITHTRPLYTNYALSTIEGNGHFSHMKATTELGYKPREMDKTISDTVAWLVAQA